MSKEITPSYVAIIKLSLPGSNEQFTANVTLVPEDEIQTGSQWKKLQDCTLADLQAYANQLEEEAWQTYEQITLVDLAKDESLDMSLSVHDVDGDEIKPSKTWLEGVVVTLTMEEQAEAEQNLASENETNNKVTETAVADEQPKTEPAEVEEIPVVEKEPQETDETPQIVVEEKDPEPASEPSSEQESDPVIIVAETEPVHEEKEPNVDTPEKSNDSAIIAPSKARVRMAGQQLPVGHPTWAAVDVLIEEPALRASQAHALTSMNREVAGVLVGPRPEKQPDGRYLVHISDTIIAKHTVMHGASVTYTPESWRYMNDVLHERYPDESAVMVGWYHTHPGFGIFLSGMDLFIHQNFFTQIWHVAFVLDPRARASGFFCWDRQKTQVKPMDFRWPSWAATSW